MNCHVSRAALLVLVSVCWTDRASAQAPFIQGGIALDARRFSGQHDDRVFDGNVPTIMIGGGGFLTPMISASIELELGAELDRSQSTTVTIAGRPQTVTTTFASRRRAVSGLFGIHSTPARAVRVGAYAGLAFTAFREGISADAPAIVLSEPPPETVFTHLAATPLIGVDVAAFVATNVAIVGSVRAQPLEFSSELRGFSVRPAAAVRISF